MCVSLLTGQLDLQCHPLQSSRHLATSHVTQSHPSLFLNAQIEDNA